MNVAIRAVRGLSLVCGIVAAALTATAVVVVCQMVFVRFVLNQNTIWQTDFVTFSLVGATFIGAPYVLMTRGHVAVDVLPLALGERGRWWLAVVATVLSLAFVATATVLTAMFWLEAWENRWVSESMWRVRMWIPYAAMPIGLGVLTLQYLADLAEILTGRARPFGLEAPLEGGI
ncbi:TRAP transporter small permease [Rhodoplanes sp. TEM]|uniref:TRAP transporter small permease protein n=1 Tax=Rhodoplanes tepidamans TaxID=200616 RepID=A0ABT5JFB6_RHOTP|nr:MULTISPECIES: TRAP transporter small permease [Rhodoplanes]MDC7788257.1 TRAP transporter small permease [Rhodoplanes tepidamans]MDC7982938.1 TRAP transporter small permease [Rhodoplanes sp. TEM]MDQ0355874.1 TRAP-type C4-dicarboxylate transport system permease small subunit [Rhodoplanes tepidamans]